jgi:hypothetical protein
MVKCSNRKLDFNQQCMKHETSIKINQYGMWNVECIFSFLIILPPHIVVRTPYRGRVEDKWSEWSISCDILSVGTSEFTFLAPTLPIMNIVTFVSSKTSRKIL